jgi:hypothetical protein
VKPNYLKLFLLIAICLFLAGGSYAQTGDKPYTTVEYSGVLDIYSKLSKNVNESSGVILFEECLWTFNDSRGEPEIYKIDKNTGKVIKTVRIKNVENHDWEDITQDDDCIYVGDFGNNKGNRKDLAIYKILKKDIKMGNMVEVEAEIISFSYDDQESFAVKWHSNNFDCESVISFGDSLMIFSKDWADYKTRMYKLPKTAGKFKINAIAAFDAGGLVTGADYNSSSENLVLVGYNDYIPFVFLFKGFDGNGFNAEEVYRINFPDMKDSQTEGVVWFDDENVIITCEDTRTFKQSAFILNFDEVINMGTTN